MRRARGVDHKRLHVSDIREERENREVVDELLRRLRVALYLKREDRTASVREILLIERMARLRLKRRVMDSLNLRIFVQIIDDLERVLDMALDPQRKGLEPLKEQERVERRERRAGVSGEVSRGYKSQMPRFPPASAKDTP